MATEVPAV